MELGVTGFGSVSSLQASLWQASDGALGCISCWPAVVLPSVGG